MLRGTTLVRTNYGVHEPLNGAVRSFNEFAGGEKFLKTPSHVPDLDEFFMGNPPDAKS
jgi:hypothetical protein